MSPSPQLTQQWVHAINAYSSQYGTNTWTADCVIGPSRVYPIHTDDRRAWAPRTYDRQEFIEMEYKDAVYPKEIHVYETYNPGAITKISMRKDTSSPWRVVWSGPRDEYVVTLQQSRIWKVDVSHVDFGEKMKYMRIDIDNTMNPQTGFTWPSWSEIDAVLLIGDTKQRMQASQLQQGFAEVFEMQLFTDVSFHVKESSDSPEEIIKAHRGVIAARSKYFFNMLSSGMKESKESTVEVTDVAPRIFRKMIEFLYSNTVDASPEDLILLRSCADRYGIKELRKLARSQFRDALEVDNAVALLEQTIALKQEKMEDDVLDFLTENHEVFFASESFDRVDEASLRKICYRVAIRAQQREQNGFF